VVTYYAAIRLEVCNRPLHGPGSPWARPGPKFY